MILTYSLNCMTKTRPVLNHINITLHKDEPSHFTLPKYNKNINIFLDRSLLSIKKVVDSKTSIRGFPNGSQWQFACLMPPPSCHRLLYFSTKKDRILFIIDYLELRAICISRNSSLCYFILSI